MLGLVVVWITAAMTARVAEAWSPADPRFRPSLLPPLGAPQPVVHPLSVKQLLQGLTQHDFEQIYFVGNRVYTTAPITAETEAKDETKSETGSVGSTDYVYSTEISPYITTKLVDASIYSGLDPQFISVPAAPVAPPGNGFGDLLFTAIYVSLALNILRWGLGALQQYIRGGNSGGRPGTPRVGPNMGMGTNLFPWSNQRDAAPFRENITLADWAGSPEVRQECSEIVSFLKNRTQYDLAGARIPKGVLMEGPPGTGKTLLAKAIANEAEASFIEMSGSEFIEMYVGLGALRVRKLFEDARNQAPCVVFIDEIDAVGKRRASGDGMATGSNEEKDQTLNQLLAEMDGFKNNTGVMVLAATNRRDILDPALLRPGRFDRIVAIPLPDMRSRRAILELYLGNLPTPPSPPLDTRRWAKMTAGSSGADLRNLVNEAAIAVAREGGRTLTDAALYAAWEKRWMGVKKLTDDRPEEVRRRVAVHEMGHAWLVHLHPEVFDLQKVSIQASYSGTGGFTLFSEKDEVALGGLYTRDVLMKRLMVALGGKAAEEVFYGADQISVGATQDLREANALATDMIEKYGMGNQLHVFYKGASQGFVPKYSEYTQRTVDREVAELVQEAYHEAVRVVRDNRTTLTFWVDRLLQETVLGGEDLFTGDCGDHPLPSCDL